MTTPTIVVKTPRLTVHPLSDEAACYESGGTRSTLGVGQLVTGQQRALV
jgi:hypothetical protein